MFELIFSFLLVMRATINSCKVLNSVRFSLLIILAHLSRKLSGELIGWPCSGVHPSSTISKIFYSETTWPVKAKLHVEHPWEGGTKVYINDPGHMIKMDAMAINSKNL